MRQVFDRDGDFHRLRDGCVPRERRVAIYEDTGKIEGCEGVFLETLDDDITRFPFVGVAGNFGAREFARDGDFSGKIVGVRGAEVGNRAASLGESRSMAAVRVNDSADFFKREVEPAMCGRVGRRRVFTFDFFAREIDQHHVGGTEFFERHAAGFDGKNAAGTVQG